LWKIRGYLEIEISEWLGVQKYEKRIWIIGGSIKKGKYNSPIYYFP